MMQTLLSIMHETYSISGPVFNGWRPYTFSIHSPTILLQQLDMHLKGHSDGLSMSEKKS